MKSNRYFSTASVSFALILSAVPHTIAFAADGPSAGEPCCTSNAANPPNGDAQNLADQSISAAEQFQMDDLENTILRASAPKDSPDRREALESLEVLSKEPSIPAKRRARAQQALDAIQKGLAVAKLEQNKQFSEESRRRKNAIDSLAADAAKAPTQEALRLVLGRLSEHAAEAKEDPAAIQASRNVLQQIQNRLVSKEILGTPSEKDHFLAEIIATQMKFEPENELLVANQKRVQLASFHDMAKVVKSANDLPSSIEADAQNAFSFIRDKACKKPTRTAEDFSACLTYYGQTHREKQNAFWSVFDQYLCALTNGPMVVPAYAYTGVRGMVSNMRESCFPTNQNGNVNNPSQPHSPAQNQQQAGQGQRRNPYQRIGVPNR